MRIKWNRQLDGSLNNRQTDGSEMQSKDNPPPMQENTKTHSAPKIFRIFRRKKRHPSSTENSDSVSQTFQEPSEVDESDCASISSVATVASQPISEVCHRDRTLSLFSSFRISLPGGKKKSKRNTPSAQSVFLTEEHESNRHSSPDLRKEKLNRSNHPQGFFKSSSTAVVTQDTFDSSVHSQVGGDLNTENSRSFAVLKSDNILNVEEGTKLSKSVSFSDCQTRETSIKGHKSSSTYAVQHVNGYGDSKVQRKYLDYLIDKSNDTSSKALNVPTITGASSSKEIPTILSNGDKNEILQTNNYFKNSEGESNPKKRSDIISEAKKKYFSHRERKSKKANNLSCVKESRDIDFSLPNQFVCNRPENVPPVAVNFGVNLKDYFPMCKKPDKDLKQSISSNDLSRENKYSTDLHHKSSIGDKETENITEATQSESVNSSKSDVKDEPALLDGKNLNASGFKGENNFDNLLITHNILNKSKNLKTNSELNSNDSALLNNELFEPILPVDNATDHSDKNKTDCSVSDDKSLKNSSAVTCVPSVVEKPSICLQNNCSQNNEDTLNCDTINVPIPMDNTLISAAQKQVSCNYLFRNLLHQPFLWRQHNNSHNCLNLLESSISLDSILAFWPELIYSLKHVSYLNAQNPTVPFDYADENSFIHKLDDYKHLFHYKPSSIFDSVNIMNATALHGLNTSSPCFGKYAFNERFDAPLDIDESYAHCEAAHFDKVSDESCGDELDFVTREKNQDRCPSYYSMSVGPAGSPATTTGVTVAGPDLLEEIDDTAQFLENKGGSITTDTIHSNKCRPAELAPAMLSNLDIPTISIKTNNKEIANERLFCDDEAPKNRDECDPKMCDPSSINGHIVSSNDCVPNESDCVKSDNIEVQCHASVSTQNQTSVVTPVFSEHSDYFSMHDEPCSTENSFAEKDTVSEYCDNDVANDSVINSETTLTPVNSITFNFSTSSSPESLELDDHSFNCYINVNDDSNSNKQSSDTIQKNGVSELKIDVKESKTLPESESGVIKSSKVNLQSKIKPPSVRKKSNSEGNSLISSLSKKSVSLNKSVNQIRKVSDQKLDNSSCLHNNLELSQVVDEKNSSKKLDLHHGLSEKHVNNAGSELRELSDHDTSSVSENKPVTKNKQLSKQTPLHISKLTTTENCDKVESESDVFDDSDCFRIAASERSSNCTLDEISLSEIYSAPIDQVGNLPRQQFSLQTRSTSLPAVVGQVHLPSSPLQELRNYKQGHYPIRDKDVGSKKSRIPRKQTGVRGALHGSKPPVRPPMWLSKAELTAEIQRLGTLCEARTKELNRLKMETKHVSVGFDAFAALFKYMVEDLDGLSVPMLSKDLQKTLKQLELAKQDLAYYEREVEEMKAHHSQELNDLSNKLFEVYQGEITELSAKHQEELDQLNYGHQQQMEALSATLQASSNEVQARHEVLIGELQQELITQREELQLFQEREIKDLEEKHALATKTLQEHVEQLQKKCAELNQHSASMESAMRNDTDSKLQWVTSRKIDLEKEVESLKTVLEMKNKELHTLRVQTLEMEKQLEELPLAREKIKMLQARAEDLEALMIEKTKVERKLSTENHMIKETYEKESKVNKRLSMENEELQWRLRQAETSMLSGSFAEVSEYPEEVENGTTSPIKTPPAPQLGRSVFFTFIDKDEACHSPRSQYKKITPGFSTNYKTSPARNGVPSPRRAKSNSEPPQPPAFLGTPRKVLKQKSTPKRPRSGSECTRSTSEHQEVTFSSVTGSMASSVSSESSVFEQKEQLLEEHEEEILETLQILREQRSVESPSSEPAASPVTEKEWCNGDSKSETVSPDFEAADMARSSEFSDPKTYYHMTFPVPKEAGIADCDTEYNSKNTSEGTTPSVEEPAETHSILNSDVPECISDPKVVLNCEEDTVCTPKHADLLDSEVSVERPSTDAPSHTQAQDQQENV